MSALELNGAVHYTSGREFWLQCKAKAAQQAVLDTYRHFLSELNGNEASAASLTLAWASLMKRDFPGSPPEIYTAASLERWARTTGKGA